MATISSGDLRCAVEQAVLYIGVCTVHRRLYCTSEALSWRSLHHRRRHHLCYVHNEERFFIRVLVSHFLPRWRAGSIPELRDTSTTLSEVEPGDRNQTTALTAAHMCMKEQRERERES